MAEKRIIETHIVYDEAKQLINDFSSDDLNGLSNDLVLKNREKYGKNEIDPPEKDPIWKQYLKNFQDPTIIILCICALATVVIGFYEKEIPLEGFGIVIAVMIATGVSFWSEYKADQAFETLKADNDNIDVKVIRNGDLDVISTKELVVGDVIKLESGDKIPADSVLINCIDLTVDESLMTGESLPVTKNIEDVKLIGGTMLVTGSGKAIVSKVGQEMQMGEILKSLSSQEEEQTPLQYKLAKLAGLISTVGLTAAILIFLGLFSSYLLHGSHGDFAAKNVLTATDKSYLLAFIAGISIITIIGIAKFKSKLRTIFVITGPLLVTLSLVYVTFVMAQPENVVKTAQDILEFFIVAVTISLALSMRKIRKDNNLVRKMLATETIGSVNVVCSDKTGTLTQNKMTVNEFFFNGNSYNKDNFKDLLKDKNFDIIKISIASNSTASLSKIDSNEKKVIGNMTEGAMLKWLESFEIDYEKIREDMPVFERISFSSDRKMMSTVTGQEYCKSCMLLSGKENSCNVNKNGDGNGCDIVLTKGAPDMVLKKCEYIYISGKVEKYSIHENKVNEFVSNLTKKAMRVIAIAYKVRSGNKQKDEIESDLILIGLVGISDPVREDVPKAVKTAKEAGVDIIMVTGDNIETARAIADEIGFLDKKSVTLIGSDFREKSDDELLKILDDLRVLARATPTDKERLVRLIQSKKKVVAVTGDGTNDAPALKRADVGISMGLKGTDVAKEASDIVLTDDNFGSIIKAVKWGRTLYENVQKFLQFQLTINFSALTIAFLSPILRIIFPNSNFQTMPFTVLQLLWVNLVMDTLAALALGLEPPRDEIMQDKPKSREESFVTKPMLFNIFVMGTVMSVFTILDQAFNIMGASSKVKGINDASTVIFTTYVFIQLFNLLNARVVKPGNSAFKNITKSYSFIGIAVLIAIVQFILTQFGGTFFNTSGLSVDMWMKVILAGIITLIVGWVFRLLQRSVFTKE